MVDFFGFFFVAARKGRLKSIKEVHLNPFGSEATANPDAIVESIGRLHDVMDTLKCGARIVFVKDFSEGDGADKIT